ncbi:MAG: N-formylglutamate amidohydrolase [Chryseolinea sp.]
MNPFNIHAPDGQRIPIVISVPHCGVAFPDEIKTLIRPELLDRPDDTDWFVDTLYDFAPSMGIAMITANYHRWVIDLNRNPDGTPLYTDGRIITGLCPLTDFAGEPLYIDQSVAIENEEIARRKVAYYDPYHAALRKLVEGAKSTFGKVLLWDCHSIRQYVPKVYRDKFPDLILGDGEGAAASPHVIETAYKSLSASTFSVSHNFPFKGGYITREYGKPLEHQQALQLEMTKINYMDDTELFFDHERADKIRVVLRRTLEALMEALALNGK